MKMLKNMTETVKTLTHKKNKATAVCPKCGSPRLDLYLGGYAGKIYRCLNCGYQGSIIIELEKEEL